MQINRKALEYHLFGAERLELENNRKLELKFKRPSCCNDQRSVTECM